MKSLTLIAVLAFASGCAASLAAEKSIFQKGKVFSAGEISIKTGDTIVFVNDDTVAHNVMSTSAGNEFNIGSQVPGQATPVTFNSAGVANVFCAIHPRMRLAVKVNN
jgi:plastocyanin